MEAIQKPEQKNIRFISLAEASRISGYHQDYLGYLARIGKLEAQKIARNWVTTPEALAKLEVVANPEQMAPPAPAMPKNSEAVKNTNAQVPEVKLLSLKRNVIDSIAKKAATDSLELFIEKKYYDLEKKNLDGLSKVIKKDLTAYIDVKLEQKINERFKKSQISFETYMPPAAAPQRKVSAGLDQKLNTQKLNIEKINKSFDNRFNFQKYLIYVLVLVILALSLGIFYTYSISQNKYAQLEQYIAQNSLTQNIMQQSAGQIFSPIPFGATAEQYNLSTSNAPAAHSTYFETIPQSQYQNSGYDPAASTATPPVAAPAQAQMNAPQVPAPANGAQDLFSGQVSNKVK